MPALDLLNAYLRQADGQTPPADAAPDDIAPIATGPAAFAAQYGPAAAQAGARIGVDPAILLGQWGMETGWGKSIVPGTNNLGNIKDFSGGGVEARDNATGSMDRYRQFASIADFADHYAGLLARRYPNALNAGADANRFASALKAGGYAEDPNYVAKVAAAARMMGGVPMQASQASQAAGKPQASDPFADILAAGLAAKVPKPQAEGDGNFVRGVKESFKQLPQLGYGLLAGAGATAENMVGEGGIATGIKNAGLRGYQGWSDTIAKDAKESDSFSYAYDKASQGDLGALGDWLAHGIGYAGGQAIQALATAGVGAAVGKAGLKVAAKKLASGLVSKEEARIAATREGAGLAADALTKQATANVAAHLGQTAAMGASALGMEGGEIYGDLVSKAAKEGRQLTGEELARAFGATLGAGALEFVGDKVGLDVMLGKSRIFKPAATMEGMKGRAARAALGAAASAPIEGATEFGQTLTEEYGKGNDPTSAESMKQALDATALGALGGATMGTAGGAFSGPEKQQQAPGFGTSPTQSAPGTPAAPAAPTPPAPLPANAGPLARAKHAAEQQNYERMQAQNAATASLNPVPYQATPVPQPPAAAPKPELGLSPQDGSTLDFQPDPSMRGAAKRAPIKPVQERGPVEYENGIDFPPSAPVDPNAEANAAAAAAAEQERLRQQEQDAIDARVAADWDATARQMAIEEQREAERTAQRDLLARAGQIGQSAQQQATIAKANAIAEQQDYLRKQQLARQAELDAIHGRVEARQQMQSRNARMDVLDQTLNQIPDAPLQNKLKAFSSALRRAGYTNQAPTPEEIEHATRHADLADAFTKPETEYAAPNELTNAVPERTAPAPAKPKTTVNTAAVDAAIASGMRLKTANGNVLHKKGSSKIFKLSDAQKAHYLKRMAELERGQPMPQPALQAPQAVPEVSQVVPEAPQNAAQAAPAVPEVSQEQAPDQPTQDAATVTGIQPPVRTAIDIISDPRNGWTPLDWMHNEDGWTVSSDVGIIGFGATKLEAAQDFLQTVRDGAGEIPTDNDQIDTIGDVPDNINQADTTTAGTGEAAANTPEGQVAPIRPQEKQQAQPEWIAFTPESGTLGIPRTDMPQIAAEHRGALTQFMLGRGITHEQEEVDPATLKPTQAEYSSAKVEKARNREGGDRAILVSSDNHVLDGHHQWLAKVDTGEPVRVIRFNAPIQDLLPLAKEFPSAEAAEGAAAPQAAPAAQPPTSPTRQSPEVRQPSRAERALLDKAPPMLDLNREPTGWKQIEFNNGNDVVLISYDGKQALTFANPNPRSGTEARRTYAYAQAYAIDNPYVGETSTGELVMQPIFQKPAEQAAPADTVPASAGTTTPEAPATPRSESQAVNDYIDGKRDTPPTVEEVAAEQAPAKQEEPPAAPAADPLDAELQDALGHLGDVLGDVFGSKLNATGQQHTASDLLPALSKVIGLLVRKGYRSFAEAVQASAKAMRGNPAIAPHIDKISARRWKAAYNNIAEDFEGTDTEAAVAAMPDEDVLRLVAGEAVQAKTPDDAIAKANDELSAARAAWQEDHSEAVRQRLQAAKAKVNELTAGQEQPQAAQPAEEKAPEQPAQNGREAATDWNAWWKSLTPHGRDLAMKAAGVTRADNSLYPNSVLWNYITAPNREKLQALYRSGWNPDAKPEAAQLATPAEQPAAVPAEPKLSDLERQALNRMRVDQMTDAQLLQAYHNLPKRVGPITREMNDRGLKVPEQENAAPPKPVTVRKGNGVTTIVIDPAAMRQQRPAAEPTPAARPSNAPVRVETRADFARELGAGNIVELPDGMRVKLFENARHGWNYAYEYPDARGIWSEASMPVIPGRQVVRSLGNALDAAVSKFANQLAAEPAANAQETAPQPQQADSAAPENVAASPNETDQPRSTASNDNGQSNLAPGDTERVPAPEQQRRDDPQPGSAPARTGDVGAGQPADVGQPAGNGDRAATGVRAPAEDVEPAAGSDRQRDAGNGRARDGGTGNPDAGARAGDAGSQPSLDPAAAVRDPRTVSPADAGPGDFYIADPLKIVGGGQVARFDKNRAAIELRNRLLDEGRKPTREEQEVLAGYTGWGSFGQELFQGSWAKPAPKAGWEQRDAWLRDNLGQAEWEGMQRSIINAHYTDPPTIQAMWDMVRRMGFTGGRVLEPSIGIGNFFGMMPLDLSSRSQRAGIELDPVTGSMAQMLYPDANIQIKGYEHSKTPDNFYDLVIGNWPFADISPADRRYNRLSPLLHDYFFLKALDHTRPGGLVVGITSAGTMDKKDIAVRAEMARKGELVAAFRLPSGAFEEYAGTKVVTDIIILRKRAEPAGMVADAGWIESKPHATPEGTGVNVNEYYHAHPDHVIGTIDFGHGTTTFRPGMIVNRPADMLDQLRRIVGMVAEGAYQPDTRGRQISYVANHTGERTGALTRTDNGLFITRGEYMAPANDVAKYVVKSEKETAKREAQLNALIDMRRLYGALIEAERKGDASAERTALRDVFEAYKLNFGHFSESFGLDYLRKIDDPFYPSLAALEIADETGGTRTYRPAAILNESTVRGARTIQNPTVRDAFVLARNQSVNPSPAQIAALSGADEATVRRELIEAGAAFETPGGDFVPSDIYLSGNVREKLRQARAGLEEGNAAMERNVAALEKVLPPDIPYYKIETQMGATWVPAEAYAGYVAHMLGLDKTDGIDVKFQNGAWKVNFPAEMNYRAEASSGFGTKHVKFKRLVRAAIANQTVNVKEKDIDGKEYVNEEATKEANGKIADMRLKFGEWLWADPVRRVELEKEYNEVRNAYATPHFDGSFLGFQGMALTLGRGPFNLREHQVNAIWRALVTRKSLNAHEVGTGKTFTMGGIAVESRRYGIAKKPIIFAHNANSKSVASEIQMMYPAAKVLYVDNLSKENIKVRMAQIANDDWDAIVVPHSLIERIGFKEETLTAMAREDILALEMEAAEAAQEDGVEIDPAMWEDKDELKKLRSVTAKQLVKQRLRIIETIRKLAQQASREDSVAFEDMGVDMVMVDEAHEFKKPPIATKMKMKGLQTGTSDRSIAMSFITKYVRGMNNGGNVHLFTGTPITNTMTEVFHMMRYMMNEEMAHSGLADWDGWFGSFAREVNDVELSSTGEYEAVTRLQAFINVPELRRMIGQYMDVVFADDMPEMRPRTVNGKKLSDKDLTDAERNELLNGRTEGAQDRPYKKVVNESSDMSAEQMEVFREVQGLARAWRNMTKKERKEAMSAGAPEVPIIHDAIAEKASFDVRLVNGIENAGKEGTPELEPHPDSKPARVVKNLLDIYRGSPNANQVVFMEQGMAKSVTRSEGPAGMKQKVTYPHFSTMHDMIERLVQAGVPREQIAAVTGATSKDKRKEIADAMNSGKIRIVFGSTDSLGVGVNMQRNLRAMHHMDAPWMPGELEQRNGRGHRQGNQWNTVLEFRYLTDRLDGRRWQVLAIKQRFITEFMKSKGEVRVIEGDAAAEEQSDLVSTFADAAGDPRVLLREKMKKKLEQLQSRERLHTQAQADAAGMVRRLRNKIERDEAALPTLREQAARAGALLELQRGDTFSATVNGQDFDKRSELADYIAKNLPTLLRAGDDIEIGQYGGIALHAAWPKYANQPYLYIDVGGQSAESNGPSLPSLESSLRYMRDEKVRRLEREIEDDGRTLTHSEAVMREPFHLADKLEGAKKQLADLERDIELNPVAAPYWLRTGAPVDTTVYWHSKPFVVTGHRYSKDGWFVLASDAQGDVVIPYMEAQDAQGLPVYEEHAFEAPTVQAAAQAAPAQAPAQPDSDTPVMGALRTGADVLADELDRLPAADRKALESHYGQSAAGKRFLDRLLDDVVNYVNRGAKAVADAIRSIIGRIASAVMTSALVFNPAALTDANFDVQAAFANSEPVPITAIADAAVGMSDIARATYELMAPVAMQRGKAFMIADKPNGKLYAFDKDGKHIATSNALFGKQAGDERIQYRANGEKITADNAADTEKITPAGTFIGHMLKDPGYTGGYTLRMLDAKTGKYAGGLAVHAVWTGDPKENRRARLASSNLADKKISFGCVNTTDDFFLNKLLPIADQFEGGLTFIIPETKGLREVFTPLMKPANEAPANAPARTPAPAQQRAGNLMGKAREEDGGESEFDTSLHGDVEAGATARALLERIATESTDEGHRAIAAQMLEHGVNPTVSTGTAAGKTFTTGRAASDYAASYDPAANHVSLYEAPNAEANLLHEFAHAATAQAIRANGPAAQRMKALYGEARRNPALRGAYGMSNIDEFVAEAHSNRAFQQALRDTPSGNRSLWQRFVDIVRSILGLPSNQANLLDQVLDAGRDLMAENARATRDGQGGDVMGTPREKMAGTIDVDGTQRPTTNSKGQPIAPTEEGVRNFWRWFGDSKAVDAEGRPEVEYHGTTADVSQFDPAYAGSDGVGYSAPAFFATPDPKLASDYALNKFNRNIADAMREMQRYKNEHPGEYGDEYEARYQAVRAAFKTVTDNRETGGGANVLPLYMSLKNPLIVDAQGKRFMQVMPDAVAKVVGEGYDGAIIRNVIDHASPASDYPSSVYFAMSPTQIKSATGNTGAFDPTTPSIMGNVRTTLSDTLANAANDAKKVKLWAGYEVGDMLNRTGKLSWWHKTIGTMDNLARRYPAFKPVYEAVQAFLGDVSRFAVSAADLAPRLLPQLETWADVNPFSKDRKKAVSAEDTKAIAAPIFEGTLSWSRDANGRPIRIEDLERQAENLTIDQKAQILLQKGVIDDEQSKRWRALPADTYDATIEKRYTDTQLAPGIVWTDAELRSMFNLGDEQVALYREFRAAIDKSITNLTISEMARMGGKGIEGLVDRAVAAPDLQSAAAMMRDHYVALARMHPDMADTHLKTANAIMNLADKGQHLIDRGYAPLMRFGQHTVYVTGETPQGQAEQIYFGMFETKAEASKVARKMREAYPQARVSEGTISEEEYRLFAGVSPETVELFGSMLGLGAEANAADEAYQEYLRLAKANRSAMKRMIHRKGIEGYSEDAGRVLASFIYSNARLTSSNLHSGEIDEAVTEIPKGQGELKDEAVRLRDHVRDPQSGGTFLSGFMFAQFLGGSVASAMVNMTQPVTMTLPYLTQWGGLGKASSRLKDAIRDARKDSTGDADLDAAMKWATEEGIVAPQEIHYLREQGAGKAALRAGDGTKLGNLQAEAFNRFQAVKVGWGRLFALAELANRRVTFIAAYRTAREEGIADPTKFAADAVARTQMVYNQGNKPRWARNPVGGLLMTFKQYSIGYLELLSQMAFAGKPGSPERKAGRRAALYMLAVLMLVGGADGLPFEQDLEDAIDGILQRLGYNFSSKRAKQEFLAKTLGDGGADFVLKGLSGIPGAPVDVSGRMGMGNLIPATGLFKKKESYTSDIGEIVGPAGDLAKRSFTAAGKVLGGDVAGAALDLSPLAVQNLAKGADMLRTGTYRDARGYKVNDVTPLEAGMKAIGFQPNSTADVRDAQYQAKDLIAQTNMRSKEIAEHWAQGLANKDDAMVAEAREWRNDWNRKNPDTPIRTNMPAIIRRARAMREDARARTLKTAGKPLKAAVRRELAEGVN